MFFYISFLALVAVASCIPATPIPHPVCDDVYTPINLTPSGWTLPLTSYSDYQNCQYHFTVPKGYFAYVEVNAFQLRYMEQVIIQDLTGIGFKSNSSLHGTNSFSNAQSWVVDFFISIKTGDATEAQLAVNITVLPVNPNVNIVKSYITFSNGGSVFINAKDWNEGESYKFTSRNGFVYIAVASQNTASNDDVYKWNNAFIYEGGVFMGTLARAAQVGVKQRAYTSISNEVIVYMSTKVDTVGAALITDKSNLFGLTHTAQYVPTVAGAFPYQITAVDGEGAVTLVSDRSHPTNVTIQTLSNSQGNGTYSYIGGGPLANHSTGVKLTDSMLPVVVTGYANTYYLSNGAGTIGFDV